MASSGTQSGPQPPTGQLPEDKNVEKLRLEVEKLRLEVESLQSTGWWDRMVGRWLPVSTAFLAVIAFWVSQYQAHAQRADALAQQIEELRRDVARPFWEAQLELYRQASQTAATIATTENDELRKRAEADFQVLYWGPLAAVEDVGIKEKSHAEVETAMVKFNTYVKAHPKYQDREKCELQRLAIGISRAIRDETGPAFNLRPTPIRSGRSD
jgi:hypothetical protein